MIVKLITRTLIHYAYYAYDSCYAYSAYCAYHAYYDRCADYAHYGKYACYEISLLLLWLWALILLP